MQRADYLKRIESSTKPFDVVVIGGGATGASVALDAATRGFDVVLLEQDDFGKGTSSRSTKLIHGGVRYLAQGNISLVREALRERSLLRRNAPHVVHEQPFIVPCANLGERLWYGAGFKVYDGLAGQHRFEKSHGLSRDKCLALAPTLQPKRAYGGVLYYDGQFDDSRLLLNIIQSMAEEGGLPINYTQVNRLLKDQQGRVSGVEFTDIETGELHELSSGCVINATGPFCDGVRQLDEAEREPLIAPSQGVHVVLPKRFLPGEAAVIVPKTSDGRVIFMIPWHGHVLVGTTDTAIPKPVLEPTPQSEEIDFLLKTAGDYLTLPPSREDVLSVFTGIRPLVGKQNGQKTSKLSREHLIQRSESGMISITGGKWTTARKMGEDCMDRVIEWGALPNRPSRTASLKLHGAPARDEPRGSATVYGSDQHAIDLLAGQNSDLAEILVDDYPVRGADVVWAARHEMARSVEDVLARRTRLLFLNAEAAIAAAPKVAHLLSQELGRNADWEATQIRQFNDLAKHYQV